jgi:thiamine phosphate synthase YjbQ (UPF0047 family)
MKSYTEYLTFNIAARMDFVNITPKVREVVKKSEVKEGLVLVNPSQQKGASHRWRSSPSDLPRPGRL